MAKLTILEYPDPRLRTKAALVERVDAELGRVIDDMFETMYAAPGIGLAAVQIGVPKRVIVMDLSGQGEEKQPRYFVNPEIVWASPEMIVHQEGSVSMPMAASEPR